MKKSFIPALRNVWLLLFLFMGTGIHAQTPLWQIAVGINPSSIPTPNYSNVLATATDAAGNVYLAGRFQGTVSFGTISLVSAGLEDAFVAKWSRASASFAWAQRAGGAARDEATAIAVAGTSVYVAGFFYSATAGFGGTTLNNAGGSGGTNDVFVAKLSDTGTTTRFSWAQRAGGNNSDRALGVAVAGTSVYVTGSIFSPTATFGGTTLTNGSFENMFIAKLTDAGATGSFAWAQLSGSRFGAEATAVAVAGNNVYVTGYFNGSTLFGNTVLTGASIYADMFVAKLTDTGNAGNFMWAQAVGGVDDEYSNAIAVNGTGIYVAGYRSVAGSSDEVLVAKLTDAGSVGSLTWTQQSSPGSSGMAKAVAVNGTSIYVVGSFTSGQLRFGALTLSNSGIGADAFVTKLTDGGGRGNFSWVQGAGGTDDDYGYAVAVNGASVFVGGAVIRPASFGAFTVTSATGLPIGFLALLTDGGALATTTSVLKTALDLYPNPAHASTMINLLPGLGAGEAVVTVVDAFGRVVQRNKVALPVTGRLYELNVTDLASGVYAVRVQTGATTAVRRLAVE